MNKRIAALLLAAVLAVPPLVSCGGPAENAPPEPGSEDDPTAEDAEVSAAEETTAEDTGADAVPQMTFDKEMNLLLPSVSWLTPNIISDEADGERVNDAQYALKLAMEERFGTSLAETYTGDIWSTSYITRLIAAGDDSFDIMYSLDLYAPGYILSDLIIPYTELEYVDLSRVYWDQNLLKCMTINGTPYFALGAYDLSYYDFTHCLVFNKNTAATYGVGDIYGLVRSNKWTLDKFAEFGSMTVADLDGDGAMNRKKDSFGYMAEPKEVLPSFWIAAGELSIAKTKDDLPYLNVTGNTRFQTVFDRLYTVMWDSGVWCSDMGTCSDYWGDARRMIGENRCLFADEIFYRLSELRDIEPDFGIIPYPMFSEDQNEYCSRVEAGSRIGMVPVTNQNPEYAGALLEAMASYGYGNLIPEYYEVALKRKASRDSESEDMLDLIFAARRYDLGDTWWCNELRDGVFKNMFAKNIRDLSSEVAKNEQIINDTISQLIDKFSA